MGVGFGFCVCVEHSYTAAGKRRLGKFACGEPLQVVVEAVNPLGFDLALSAVHLFAEWRYVMRGYFFLTAVPVFFFGLNRHSH